MNTPDMKAERLISLIQQVQDFFIWEVGHYLIYFKKSILDKLYTENSSLERSLSFYLRVF